MVDLSFKYERLIKFIRAEAPFVPDISIVLGSGLGEFSESLDTIKIFFSSELPGYPASAVEGHSSQIKFSEMQGKKLLIFSGRFHFYEGFSLSECILPIFIAHKTGCKQIILTNAAGGINQNFLPGDLMLADSFNALSLKKELTGLIRLASLEKKNKFNCPSIKLNEFIKLCADKEKIDLKTGVYFYTKGPAYETPSEIQFIKRFGGDAVGMSTVHEAIFAAYLGLEVSAISCITNLAAGISGEKLSHNEVRKTAAKVMNKFSKLLKRVVSDIRG